MLAFRLAGAARRAGLGEITSHDIHLVSCARGWGIENLLEDVSERAARRHSDIYIVGAANVGKSTFLNQILELHNNAGGRGRGRKGASSSSRNRGVTTSPLPGTTLDFLCIDLNTRWRRHKRGRGGLLYDTPGLIMPHQLTARLTTEELSAVVPTRRVHHTTLRVAVGNVAIDGLHSGEVREVSRDQLLGLYASAFRDHSSSVMDLPTFDAPTGGWVRASELAAIGSERRELVRRL